MFRSKSFHSPFGRASYFLCSCRESKQRDTPPTPHLARAAREVPCASRRRRAGANSRIPALGHARLSPAAACDARCGEGGGRSRAPPSVALRQLPPLRRGSENCSPPAQRGKVPEGRKEALLILISGSPFAAARAGRKCLKGRAHDAREFVARTGTCVQRTPACARAPVARSAKGAASGVHFSWLLLFVQAKRS